MEKQIVWTAVAEKDFWEIVQYLRDCWPEKVVDRFHKTLAYRTHLLQHQPNIGFKSTKYSKYRRLLINRHYVLIYSVEKMHILIHRIKHVRMR